MKHAKKRHHRIMKLKWNEEKKSALGRLMGGEGNFDYGKEEPYDPPCTVMRKTILRTIVTWPLPV